MENHLLENVYCSPTHLCTQTKNRTFAILAENRSKTSAHSMFMRKYICRSKWKRYIPVMFVKESKLIERNSPPSSFWCNKFFLLWTFTFSYFSFQRCYRFTKRHTLQNHEKIHTGEKNFICDICGKSFVVKSTLNYHLLTHTDEKNHVCSICGKGFKTAQVLGKAALLRTTCKICS